MKPFYDYHRRGAKGHRPTDRARAVIVDGLIDALTATQCLQVIRQQVEVVGVRVQRRNIALFSLPSIQAVIVVHGEGGHHLFAQYSLYAARYGRLARTAVAGNSEDEYSAGFLDPVHERFHCSLNQCA